MGTNEKKKLYRMHVREQVLSGNYNNAETGKWLPNPRGSASIPSNHTIRNSLFGTAGRSSWLIAAGLAGGKEEKKQK